MPTSTTVYPVAVRFGLPPCQGVAWVKECNLYRDLDPIQLVEESLPRQWDSEQWFIDIETRECPALIYELWPRLLKPTYVKMPWPIGVVKSLEIVTYADTVYKVSAYVIGHWDRMVRLAIQSPPEGYFVRSE